MNPVRSIYFLLSLWIIATVAAANSVGRSVPDEKGDFTLENIEPGRVRLTIDLPDETWYVRSLARKVGAATNSFAQTGLTLKAGEKVTGVVANIGRNGARIRGKVVPLQEGQALPRQSQLLLIPAISSAADDPLQSAECLIGPAGDFEFRNLAPGKYWALLKPVENVVQHPVDWDPALRAKIRKEAESRKVEVELSACQRAANQVIRLGW